MPSVLDFVKNSPMLFIGCHPDDVELGCAGIIHQLQNKVPIYIVTLSKNQKNQKNPNLINEHYQSLKLLGIKKSNIVLGDFTTREFSSSRQEILDFLIKIRNKIKPRCVFTHSSDLHQDHKVCYNETINAFRTQTIIEYFVSRSMHKPKPTLFVNLNKKDLNVKINALSKYKTYKDKNYFSKEIITSLCKSPGIPMEIPLCEAFNPVSIII